MSIKCMVVRKATSLSPINMVENKEAALARSTVLAEKLYCSDWISTQKADSEEFSKNFEVHCCCK